MFDLREANAMFLFLFYGLSIIVFVVMKLQ